MTNALLSGFDHAVIAVRDIDSAIAAYRALGFECTPGGHHAGRGTHNAIVAFGEGYIELIGVHDQSMARSCGGNVLDLVRYLEDRGDGPLGFAFAAEDLGALQNSLDFSSHAFAGSDSDGADSTRWNASDLEADDSKWVGLAEAVAVLYQMG